MKRLIIILLLIFAQNAAALQKNVASQKWVVFAFDITDNTAKTGDAAQITANLRIDGGAANAVDDTNPTELEDGYYVFDITATESNGDCIVICPASSTGSVQVIGCPMAVWTTAPNSEALSIDSNGRVDLIKIAGTTQTANDNGADINAILLDTDAYDSDAEYATAIWDAAISGHTGEATFGGELQTIDPNVTAILADTAELQGDWANGGRLDLIIDAVLADTAAYDTDAEYATAIWNALTASYGGAGTYGQAAEDILTDTGTTLQGELDGMQGADGKAVISTDAQDLSATLDVNTKTITAGAVTAAAIATNAVDADALAADAVTEIWAKAMSDLATGAPSATASVLTAINYLYEAWRNKTITNGTNSEIELYKDDGLTKLVESDISDDGTDFTRGEMGAPD